MSLIFTMGLALALPQAGPADPTDEQLFHCKWAGEIAAHEYQTLAAFGLYTEDDVSRARVVAGRSRQALDFRRSRAGGAERLAAAERAAQAEGRDLQDRQVLDREIATCAALFRIT